MYNNNERIDFESLISDLQDKDTRFYFALKNRAESEGIVLDESKNIIFDLAMQKGISWFEQTEGYSEKDTTKAFIIAFGSWIWEYCEEKNISIRRIWYLLYKQMAQRLWRESYLRKNLKTKFNDLYSALLSDTLWEMIRNNPNLYYESFSVKDISRMSWKQNMRGFPNLFVFVEKNSTTAFFEETCRILGIRSLVSGGGKPSAANTEKILSEHTYYHSYCPNCLQFANQNGERDNWRINCSNCDTELEELPILLLTLTDFDEDGIRGVESGIINQLQIYANRKGYPFKHIRVGISPDDLEEEQKTPYDKCFILPKQPTPSSIGEEILENVISQLQNGISQKRIVENLGISRTRVANIKKALENGLETEQILNEFCNWALAHGIPFEENGEMLYLGIELEALPTKYFFPKILEAIKTVYDIRLMSEWARHKQTPEEYEYKNSLDSLAEEYLQEQSEYKYYDKQVDILNDAISELEDKKSSLKNPYIDSLWEKGEELVSEPNWDDRERIWNEDLDNWNEESLKTLYHTHDLLLTDHVTNTRDFHGWSNTFSFEKNQLTSKLNDFLKSLVEEDEIDLPEPEEEKDLEELEESIAIVINKPLRNALLKLKDIENECDYDADYTISTTEREVLELLFEKLDETLE